MTTKQIQIIRHTWQTVAEEPLTTGILFYDRLFTLSPSLRGVFRSPISNQTIHFMKMVGCVINHLEDMAVDSSKKTLPPDLLKRKYDVYADQYLVIADALLWTIEKGLGTNWNEKVKEAWSACSSELSEVMLKEAMAA